MFSNGRGDGRGHHRGGYEDVLAGGVALLAIAVLAGLLWWLLRRRRVLAAIPTASPVTPAAPAASPIAAAESILAERLAHGDIEPDDYRTRLATLREGMGGTVPLAPSHAADAADPLLPPPALGETPHEPTAP